MRHARITAVSAALTVWVCSGADAAAPEAVRPPQEGWKSVSEMLGARCGSLDCHGQQSRPLRLFHHSGLRLAADDTPGGDATTTAEHDANLRAVAGLEPELFARVVGDGGRDPERLTLVRKALGLEDHKAGAPLEPAGAADVCLRSWLAARTEEAACESGAEVSRP